MGEKEKIPVLIEMRVKKGVSFASAMETASSLDVSGLEIDKEFTPISLKSTPSQEASLSLRGEETVLIRGKIDEDKITELKADPKVVRVDKDVQVAPFTNEKEVINLSPTAPTGTCPIPPCDCTFGNPANGTISDVANYLGVNQIWAQGFKGDGIVIGIVDGGTLAVGRTTNGKVERVIDGWPSNWGQVADWGEHGCMTSYDALGMAPNAQIYDIRIAGSYISNAIAGYNWAINKHRSDGTPHILSNSWGIFQESWDMSYARDPDHPFTRKVVEALDEGIIVLFAAGNCGEACPDGRCGADNGPGRSIWGANGHPRVMTVGAVNLSEQLVGYSSQGEAALNPEKPDFCALTHFEGYFPNVNNSRTSDGGTSAATPIAAGVVALFKQSKPTLTQDQIKNALKNTAKNIGPSGWDIHSGSGIIQAKAAYDYLHPPTCKRYYVRALRYISLYRRTRNLKYLCAYYKNLASYYCCLFRGKPKVRKYRCSCYLYVSKYYQCLYKLTRKRTYLEHYNRYRQLYLRCRLSWGIIREPRIVEPELEKMLDEELFSETESIEEEMLLQEEPEPELMFEEMIPEPEGMPEEILIPIEEEPECMPEEMLISIEEEPEFLPDEFLMPQAKLMPEEEVMLIEPEFGVPEELTVSRCEMYRVYAYRYLNLYRRTRSPKYLCLYYRYFAAYRCCQLNI
jgi:hypothetical protein